MDEFIKNIQKRNNLLSRIKNHKKSFYLGIFIILVLVLPLMIFISSRRELTDLRGRANLEKSAEELTDKLLTSKANQNDILSMASVRKDKMKKLAEANPESFLQTALDNKAINSFPSSSREFFEKDVEKTGTISPADLEDPDNKDLIFKERINNKVKTFNVKLTPDLNKKIEGKTRVKAKGYVIDKIFVPYQLSVLEVLGAATSVLGVNTTPGERKVAIIYVNFSDLKHSVPTNASEVSREYPKSELDRNFFTDPTNSAKKFYDLMSGGRVNFTGTFFGPVTLNAKARDICKSDNQNGGDVDDSDINAELLHNITADVDQKINISGFPHRVYIYPRLGTRTPSDRKYDGCSMVGWSTIGVDDEAGVNYSRFVLNGKFYQSSSTQQKQNTKAIIHEFGHSLGLGHASTLTCGQQSIDRYSKCSDQEYGDRWDVMGYHPDFFPQIGGFNRSYLNYIPAEGINTIQGSGTFELKSTSKPYVAGDIQLINIRRKNAGDNLFIEYRRPVSYDSSLPASVTNGALIKLRTNKISTRNAKYKTFLLDATPGENSASSYSSFDTNWFKNSSLVDNQPFYDPVENLRITQLSHDTNKVTLKIERGVTPCNEEKPGILISPSNKTGGPGLENSYTVEITNNDSTSCARKTYNFSTVLPSNLWKSTFSQQTLQLSPDQSGSFDVKVTSPSTAVNGRNRLTLKASYSGKQTIKNFFYTIAGVSEPTPTVTPSPSVSPTPSPRATSITPIGYHDASSCSVSTGWTCDGNDFAKALSVHFYADGPAGVGTFIGSTTANGAREIGVANVCGGNSAHGFSFNTPASLKNGSSHRIYAYAINIGPTGSNPILINSPKSITCGVNPTPSTASCKRTSPTVTIASTSKSAAPGKAVNYRITLKGNDSSTCAQRQIAFALTTPNANWSYSPTSTPLGPNETKSIDLRVTSPSNATVGTKTLQLKISGDNNGVVFTTRTLQYVVTK